MGALRPDLAAQSDRKSDDDAVDRSFGDQLLNTCDGAIGLDNLERKGEGAGCVAYGKTDADIAGIDCENDSG